MKLPPFYTARYVEINSAGLSLLWLASGLAIVLLTVSSAPSRFLIVPFFSPTKPPLPFGHSCTPFFELEWHTHLCRLFLELKWHAHVCRLFFES